jgi:hypothetical protein
VRNRPDSEPIDSPRSHYPRVGKIDDRSATYPFRAAFNPLRNPNNCEWNNRALNGTCFHDLAGSIGATKTTAESSNQMGYVVEAVSHRLTDTIMNSRSASPREQLTIRKATYTTVQSGRTIRCACPPLLLRNTNATTAIRQILPRQPEHGV